MQWVKICQSVTSDQLTLNLFLKPPFHWTAIRLRPWRSRIFSKIIPNRRGSVDSDAIWKLDASSTLPLRFYYASATLLLRSHYDIEELVTLSLRWWRCSCDLATTSAKAQCVYMWKVHCIARSTDTLHSHQCLSSRYSRITEDQWESVHIYIYIHILILDFRLNPYVNS